MRRNLLGLPQQVNSSFYRDRDWDIVFETAYQEMPSARLRIFWLYLQTVSFGGNPLAC